VIMPPHHKSRPDDPQLAEHGECLAENLQPWVSLGRHKVWIPPLLLSMQPGDGPRPLRDSSQPALRTPALAYGYSSTGARADRS
jgi:hypothetical protein